MSGTRRVRRDDVLEPLADAAHECWSSWMHYLFEKCDAGPDGTVVIPSDLAARWQRQLETPYAGLSEPERESDRDVVRRYVFPYLPPEWDADA